MAVEQKMQQFEKWWRTSHSHFGPIPKDCSKSTWKAALKWIYYEGVLDNTLAGDLIKEELNDKKI